MLAFEGDDHKDTSDCAAGPSDNLLTIPNDNLPTITNDNIFETAQIQKVNAPEVAKPFENDSNLNNVIIEEKNEITEVPETMKDSKSDHEAPTVTRKRRICAIPSSGPPDMKRLKPRKPWNLLLEGDRRKSLRNSSRESSTERATPAAKGAQAAEQKPALDKKSKSRNSLIDGTERRNSLRSSSCDSGSDRKKKLSSGSKPIAITSLPKNQPLVRALKLRGESSESESGEAKTRRRTTKVQELKDSESDSGPSKVRRKALKPIQASTDDSELEQQPANEPTSDDTPLARIPRAKKVLSSKRIDRIKEDPVKNNKKPSTSKPNDSSGGSEFASDNQDDISRNLELKSRLSPIDYNSKTKSSILIRNDYLKSTDKKSKKTPTTAVSALVDHLSKTIEEQKSNDRTYLEPPKIEKRERLRTSAFKGNEECSNDEDIQSESEPEMRPSVSRGSSVENSPSKKSSERKRGRRSKEIGSVVKKVFTQPELEAAIEKKVPYTAILDAIKFCVPTKGGRACLKLNKEYEEKRAKLLKMLKPMKFFRCGSCKFEVTKHKWIDHFAAHGGLAWIDELEAPIKIEEFNETLRRYMKNVKIYDQPILTCPNCREEKKSALGHLSHILICGESKKTVEARKLTCELCNEKYFPFYASLHRNKCSGYQKVQEVGDGDDEGGSSDSDNELKPDSFNASGRTKRKAVKR